jgi:hypothetical protein
MLELQTHQWRSKMKSLAVAIAITLIAAGSALAAPRHVSQSDRAKLSEARAMVVDTESNDVYIDGQLIGRDPDPSIRQHLRDEYYAIRR